LDVLAAEKSVVAGGFVVVEMLQNSAKEVAVCRSACYHDLRNLSGFDILKLRDH
jgi:hypothetical protein